MGSSKITPSAGAIDSARSFPMSAALDTIERLAQAWRLSMIEACALAGLADTVGPYVSTETQTRIENLVAIDASLAIFSAPLRGDWPTLPNKGALFGGRRPLDVMVDGGLPAIVAVRAHVSGLGGALAQSNELPTAP